MNNQSRVKTILGGIPKGIIALVAFYFDSCSLSWKQYTISKSIEINSHATLAYKQIADFLWKPEQNLVKLSVDLPVKEADPISKPYYLLSLENTDAFVIDDYDALSNELSLHQDVVQIGAYMEVYATAPQSVAFDYIKVLTKIYFPFKKS